MTTDVKSSGVAIVLSFLWTGLGQLYAGRLGRGLTMMLATPLVWSFAFMSACYGSVASVATVGAIAAPQAAGPNAGRIAAAGSGMTALGLLGATVGLLWWVWGMVDARKQCDAFNTRQG